MRKNSVNGNGVCRYVGAVPDFDYRKVASSNSSRLEAQAGFFRLLMKGIFDPYVL